MKPTSRTALFVLLTVTALSNAAPAFSQNAGADAWKNCQSNDADKRILGCTAVIQAKGFGSAARLSDALDGRCWAYHVQSKYELAIADCKASIAIRPDYVYAHNNLGTAYLGLGDYPNALIALNRAIELKRNFVFPWLNRAKTFAALGKTEEARRDFAQVLALDPNNGEAKAALSQTASNTAKPMEPVASPSPRPDVPESVPGAKPVVNVAGERRVALVIGNSAYQAVEKLPNPARDAASIADQLRRVGFQEVIQETDLNRERLENTLRRFARTANGADWAVIYYAGHGIEMAGINYLVPVDAKIESDRDVELESISMSRIMAAAEGARKLRLVILDACRTNPFISQMRRAGVTRAIGRGLARVEPAAGSLVVYAAKDGETAADGDTGNSPFATALAKRIAAPGVEVRRLFDLVRDDVLASTNQRQQPFSYGSLSGSADFYFVSK